MTEPIEFKPHIFRRLFAGLIDYLILLLIWIVLGFGLLILIDPNTFPLETLVWFLMLGFWFLLIVGMEYKFNATIGNKITGLRPKSLENNEKPTLTQSFLRHLLDPIDLLFMGIITIIIIMNTDKKQRFGDLVAGTYVVKK